MRTAAAMGLTAAALSACGKPAPEVAVLDGHKMTFPNWESPGFEPPPPVWTPRHVSPPERFRFTGRPTVLASYPVDYAGLDTLTETHDSNDTVTFGMVGTGVKVTDSTTVAELQIDSQRSFSRPESATPLSFFPKPGFVDASTDPLAGLEPKELRCTRSDGNITIRGFRKDAWDDASLKFVVYKGPTGTNKCTGKATAIAKADARALVPGVLYAFRRCTSGCEAGSTEKRREELVIIGPPSDWVASTAAVSEQAFPHVGSFTIAAVPLERGSSASVLLHVEARALAYFVGLRGIKPAWTDQPAAALGEVLAYSVEISWPQDAASPQGIGFVSKATPLADMLLDTREAAPAE
ncbi:MAG: hypothetical protein HOW73_33005 [Polyangiaceae bacterium]|nr:hypothetical protein [Polyangiaceae bacterium]